MRLFIDANILVAVLNREYPLFDTAARVLSLSDKKGVTLFTSPVCLSIAFYFAEKKSGAARAKEKIEMLCDRIGVAGSSEKSAFRAISDPKVLDLEDGFEYYSAMEARCEYIITEDVGDFYFSEIPVMGSREFLIQMVNDRT